ncbi:MAG: hypothetical protein IJ333_04820 [Clostridia bacterium]|nr:hypothetical protein [Clostridia bacterium]
MKQRIWASLLIAVLLITLAGCKAPNTELIATVDPYVAPKPETTAPEEAESKTEEPEETLPVVSTDSPAAETNPAPEEPETSEEPEYRVDIIRDYPAVTKSEMVKGAEVIAIGHFISAGAPYKMTLGTEETGKRTEQYTRLQFEVSRVIKGEELPAVLEVRAESDLNVKANTGYDPALNASSLATPDTVRLLEGKTVSLSDQTEYLLILNIPGAESPSKEEGDYFTLYMGDHGVLTLNDGVWSGGPHSFADETLEAEIMALLTEEPGEETK